VGEPGGPCRGRNLNLAVRPDGRILLAASGDLNFVREYSVDGRRNASFRMPIGLLRRRPRHVGPIAVDGRGRVLLGGTIGGGVGVVRLTPRGLPDRSFGHGGEASRRVGRLDKIADLRVEPSGGIVVAGTAYMCKRGRCDYAEPLVSRFAADGRFDRRFGGRGIWTGLPGRVSGLKALALESGSILAAGSTVRTGSGRDVLLLRLRR
jgi:hypothetical protein